MFRPKCPRVLAERLRNFRGAKVKPIVWEQIKACGCDKNPSKACAYQASHLPEKLFLEHVTPKC